MPPADPKALGPYRIVRRVGSGGMGVVYEAVHTGLDKRVALKVLPRELAAARLERFLREARTAAALHHTNIVPVFDVGQVDGVPYYAMQLIDGTPLGGLADCGTRNPELELPTRTHTPDPVPEADGTRTYPSEPGSSMTGSYAGQPVANGALSSSGTLTVARRDAKHVVGLIL